MESSEILKKKNQSHIKENYHNNNFFPCSPPPKKIFKSQEYLERCTPRSQVPWYHGCQHRLLYTGKLFSIVERKTKTFYDISTIIELMYTKATLRRLLKAIL